MKSLSALRFATPGPRPAAASVFSACLAAATAGAAPDSPSSLDGYAFPSWAAGAISCGEGFERSAPDGWRCLSDRLGGAAAQAAAEFVNAQGRALFGPNFRFVHSVSWSPWGEGLNGNADAVVPLAAFSAETGQGAEAAETGALFLQQGVTRWIDVQGLRRNDLRFGVVYRFSPFDNAGTGMFGLSTLVQESLERGHRRVVAGVDYVGRWGQASLQRFVPATDWRPGRFGHMERPRGGTRLGARLDLTTTLALDASLADWETAVAGRRETDGRLALGWRPHPWLDLRAGWAGLGSASGSTVVAAAVKIPFGGGMHRIPRWEGLGVAGRSPATADAWRPVENVERLETIEREMTAAELLAAGSVGVRFLQPAAASGAEIGVEVYIPAPLSSDLALVVRLAPGSGENPAIPGVDYVDEPAEIAIRAGATTARAAFQLLLDPSMREIRSLAATVSPAA